MMASISSTTHSVSSQLPASVCQRPSSRNNSSSRSSFPYHFRSDSAQLTKLLGLLQQKTLRSSFLSRYVVGDILGQGGYGLVAEAHDTRTHQPVAVKFVFKNKIKTQMVHDRWFGRMIPMEAYVLAQLDHPNAIRLLDFDEDRNLYYLVTELHGTPWTAPVTGHTSRDLFDCIEHHGRLSEDIARKIMAQVISCVQHMAERGFFHRDIKDENILVDENFNVKITDFGSTVYSKEKEYSKAKVDRFFGTVTYAAPEIFHQQSYVAEPAEVWALGVLLYNMLFGKAPFADKFQVLYGSFARPTAHTSPECMHLLRGMLAKSPADRMTLADVQAHRWFTPSAPPSPLLRLLQK